MSFSHSAQKQVQSLKILQVVIWEAVWHRAQNASTDGGGVPPAPSWGGLFFSFFTKTRAA